MTVSSGLHRNNSFIAIALGALAFAAGCDMPQARFHLNMAHITSQNKSGAEISPEHEQQIADTLTAMFGTPDAPFLPTGGNTGIEKVIDAKLLEVAAGPVGVDENGRTRGLYRQHCVHCHGISGDGAGPTAWFLNPYPRDFRMGVFKFKSTPRGYQPTNDDLHRIMANGVQGTAMPSFALLDSGQIKALVNYVKYLSIRGQVERKLVELAAAEGAINTSPEILIDEILTGVVGDWIMSEASATPVPEPPADFGSEESIARGRALFYGDVAACVKCHGELALGDGQATDYDEWFKDLRVDTNKDWIPDLERMGMLPPRTITPRNLRSGVYRGGRRPVDLYWRLVNGIDGTPMPAVLMRQEGEPAGPSTGLSPDELWSLVDYVRHMPLEELSRGQTFLPENERQRN